MKFKRSDSLFYVSVIPPGRGLEPNPLRFAQWFQCYYDPSTKSSQFIIIKGYIIWICVLKEAEKEIKTGLTQVKIDIEKGLKYCPRYYCKSYLATV